MNSITTNAQADGKLTLGELEKFLQDARTLGIPDNAHPKVRMNFGGTIRQITAEPTTGARR